MTEEMETDNIRKRQDEEKKLDWDGHQKKHKVFLTKTQTMRNISYSIISSIGSPVYIPSNSPCLNLRL